MDIQLNQSRDKAENDMAFLRERYEEKIKMLEARHNDVVTAEYFRRTELEGSFAQMSEDFEKEREKIEKDNHERTLKQSQDHEHRLNQEIQAKKALEMTLQITKDG